MSPFDKDAQFLKSNAAAMRALAGGKSIRSLMLAPTRMLAMMMYVCLPCHRLQLRRKRPACVAPAPQSQYACVAPAPQYLVMFSLSLTAPQYVVMFSLMEEELGDGNLLPIG